ncbi:hypothetical protein J2S52_003969 [Streptomyces sp. DSM 41037]|nr:hypothetical protein [Streptomyces sp. DSM 41037]
MPPAPAAFVLAFVVVRAVTRLIRAGNGPFHDVAPGGPHIHHVVPGVILMVAGGSCAVGSGRQGFGAGAAAVVLGVGAGLVLDESAPVLHRSDVYRTGQGRQSVEMVVMAAALGGLVLAGFSPLGVADAGPRSTRAVPASWPVASSTSASSSPPRSRASPGWRYSGSSSPCRPWSAPYDRPGPTRSGPAGSTATAPGSTATAAAPGPARPCVPMGATAAGRGPAQRLENLVGGAPAPTAAGPARRPHG